MSEEPKAIEYKLRLRPDGTAVVNLSNAHKSWLKYLAFNGGESIIDWEHVEKGRQLPPEQRKQTMREHMSKLHEMGLTVEINLLTSDSRCLVRLTDMGRNIVSEILKEPIL